MHIPLPVDARLLALCQGFVQRPDAHQAPRQWADQLQISLHTAAFSTMFRRVLGAPPSGWLVGVK